MIEFSRLTVLIIAEILIGLSLFSGLLVTFTMRRKISIRKAARQLVERIRYDMEARSECLKQKLITAYGYQGDPLEQALQMLNLAEKGLYQNLINGFLKQDPVTLQQLDVDVNNLVLAYQGLEPSLDAVAPPASKQQPSHDERVEIERLQADNQRLTEELKVTMDTMGRMLSEYAAMFSSEENDQPDEKDVIGRLQQDDAAGVEQQAGGPAPANAMKLAGVSEDLAVDRDTVEDDSTQAVDKLDDAIRTEAITESHDRTEDPVIEEVLEVDDDFNELSVNQASSESERESKTLRDALVDELESVDITPPEFDDGMESDVTKLGSLEEEWAMLLEEDAKAGGAETSAVQDNQV